LRRGKPGRWGSVWGKKEVPVAKRMAKKRGYEELRLVDRVNLFWGGGRRG